MGAIANHCIFTVSRATARIAAYLQCGRARGHIIHCKYAVIVRRVTLADRRGELGTFSPSWGLLWCPQRPQEKVLSIGIFLENSFQTLGSAEGAPRRVAVRITAFYSVPCDGANRCIFTVWEGTGPHNPLQKCSDPVPRDERRSKERARSFFPFPGPPLVPAEAPGKSFGNQRAPPK